MIFGTYPIILGTDQPIVKVWDSAIGGNELNDTLDENTYVNFATVPRIYESTVDIWISEELGFPLYNAVISGVESANQLGLPENTYEGLEAQIGADIGTDTWTELPMSIGTIAKGARLQVRLKYTSSSSAALGMKIFGVQVTGDWSG